MMDIRRRRFLLAVLLAACTARRLVSEEPSVLELPLSGEHLSGLEQRLEAELVAATRRMIPGSENVSHYSRRGDALFFLARFDEAVADYDRMVELDGTLAETHWRRGIALFYAGRFPAAASQFEKYHSFDKIDRENGIWRYLSQYRAHGQKVARAGLLMYDKDDREPFPSVYKLFGGTMVPSQILEQIEWADVSTEERQKRLFYAHLYTGLNDAVEGDALQARHHLRLSTLNPWALTAGYGPAYMWHVGRLHENLLRTKPDQP